MTVKLNFCQEQISPFRYRDRTVGSTALSAAELVYTRAINDELHHFGALRMDLYVTHLQKMPEFFENQKKTVKAIEVV